MRARVGKIARLPGAIRDELNRRLHNGALGKNLVPWLNDLPEVKHVLAERFTSRPITEDNLSEWRHGGFQDWLREEERRVRLRELSANDHDGDPEKNARRFHAHMEERLTMELAEELERLSAMKDRTARWKHLQRLTRELCRLQRTHQRGLELHLFHAKTIFQKPRSRRHEEIHTNTTENHQPIKAYSSPIQTLSELFGPFRAKEHGGGR